MDYIKLKNSDLLVSRLCMGGCPMGGYGWGDVQEQELIEAVHTALENGVTFFDTADTYGLGQSEKVLGKALGKRRKDVVIATKFGVKVQNGKTTYDNSPEYIKDCLDASLKRLDTDYIDLYQVHYRDNVTPLNIVIETLEEEKKAGKIRYYGLSNIKEEDIEEIRSYAKSVVSFQNEYSLAIRKNEKLIRKVSSEMNISPLTWGSLGQGILTGKYNKDSLFESNDRRSREIYVNFHGKKLLKNLEIVEVIKRVAIQHRCSPSAVAIRFILDWIEESVVLVGAKRSSQVLGNVEGCGWKLEKEELKMLDEVSREVENNNLIVRKKV